MTSTVSRSVLILGMLATALLVGGRAQGQTGGAIGTGTGGATGSAALAASDFSIVFQGYSNGQWVQMSSTDQTYFFNQARCQCDQDPNGEFRIGIQAGTGVSQQIRTILGTSLENSGQGLSYLFAGTQNYDCLTPNSVGKGYSPASYCTNLQDPNTYPGQSFTLSAVAQQNVWVSDPIPVARLFGAFNGCGPHQSCDSTNDCSSTNSTVNIQFWAQTNNGSGPDFDAPSASVNMVGTVPLAPTIGTVTGGNEALIVNWSWPLGATISTDTSLSGVQLFCQRGANTQVYKTGTFGAAYKTASGICPDTVPPTTGGDLSSLDPRFLCSGLIPASTTSYRITGLQNGINYGVGVAAVDKFGNISAISGPMNQMPIPTVDFYSEYKTAGGSAQGGFCSLGSWHSRRSATLVICLVGLTLVLVVRRRRGPPGIGPLVLVLATGTLLAGPARAQEVYHDSAIVQDQATEAWGGTPREYAIEARFGLYTPNVDSEFSKTKPLADVFGTKRRPMWQLEFDWEFLQEFGTLSLGGVIGYYKENAMACTLAGLQADGTCPATARSGDNTSLRLIPLAVLLVYRMDEAARHWKIPLVPYAKIGLNYTIWTITNGNGDVAWFTDSKGHSSKGQGGTMGWQAAVGLSLSLDFIDPGAARGFDADAGVNHTYAFFELDHIDGSGLYRKDVLRVGDDTWFAGLMFEF